MQTVVDKSLLVLSIANMLRVSPGEPIKVASSGIGVGKCACGCIISRNKPMCQACRTKLEQEVACK